MISIDGDQRASRSPVASCSSPVAGCLFVLLLASCRRDVELTVHVQPTARCSANGSACGADGDCCSGRCIEGSCGPPPACQAEGASCRVGSDCCSLVCGDDGSGEGTQVCLNPAGCAS